MNIDTTTSGKEFFFHKAINRGHLVFRGEKRLFFLASGDVINPHHISAIRVSEKASRSTGQIGAFVYVCADGSWYPCQFSDVEKAREYVDLLFELVNWLLDDTKDARDLAASRAASTATVEKLLNGVSRHAAPGDTDPQGSRDDV